MVLLASGKQTKSYWTWPFSSWIYPLKIVIFHSYVSLPEGMFYSPEVFWITIRCHSVGFASDARSFCPMVACAWKFAGLIGGYPSGRRCDHQMHGQQKWNYCLSLFHSIYIRHRIIQTWYIYIYHVYIIDKKHIYTGLKSQTSLNTVGWRLVQGLMA